MKPPDLRPAVRPGSILDARPLPRPPRAQSGLLHTLAKFLGSSRRVTDLRTALLQVSALQEGNKPDLARLRLDSIAAHLREIRRDGTQFVLSFTEWESIAAAGASTLQAARQTRARPEIVATILAILDALEEFAAGKLERSL